MTMTPRVRKFTLSVHLSFSVGWIGAVFAYLALSTAAMTSQNAQTMRAAWIAMELTGWYVIVPLALASLLTGLVMALGTTWGLFRHYWVLISLTLTILASTVLLMHMPDVSILAGVAKEANAATLDEGRKHLLSRLSRGDLLHPGIGLVVLLVIQVLNVYKPKGMTRYGQRKQRRERARPARQPAMSQP